MATYKERFISKKIQEAQDYKLWNQDMIFALQNTKL